MLLSLALAVVPSVVWASAADPTVATDFAAGSTGRADPRSLSAVITSPGVLALERQYTLGGSARFGPRQGRAYHAGASTLHGRSRTSFQVPRL